MAGNLERLSMWGSAAMAVSMFSLRCILVFPPSSPAFEPSAFRLMLDFSRLKVPLPAQEKVATRKNIQASKIGKSKPQQTEPAAEKAAAPKTDNGFSMEPTWKVAADQTERRIPQKPSNPKPEKQPKTQKATLKNRNFPPAKSRNKKIQQTKINPEKTQKQRKPTRKPTKPAEPNFFGKFAIRLIGYKFTFHVAYRFREILKCYL